MPLVLVLASSPIVLCVCVHLGSLFPELNSPSSKSWAETLRRAARVPPPPWPRCSNFLRAVRDPLQPSNCCSHLEQPPQSRNGAAAAIAEGRQGSADGHNLETHFRSNVSAPMMRRRLRRQLERVKGKAVQTRGPRYILAETPSIPSLTKSPDNEILLVAVGTKRYIRIVRPETVSYIMEAHENAPEQL